MTTKTGAAGATTPKVKTYKKLGDALVAFDNGLFPKGTKIEIGPTSTRITRQTKHTRTDFFVFEGNPSQFAALLLKQIVKTKLKVSAFETVPAAPPADG